MGKIIEGVWDCVYCGAKKVRGGLRECPQCGHPRDENVTFYIDNPKNYVYDEKAAAKARAGPDWLCPSCDCLNPADTNVCIGCGTVKDADTKNYFQNQTEKHIAKHKTYTQEETDYQAFHPDFENPITNEKPKKQTINWRKICKIGIPIVLVIALIIGVISLFIPREISGTVTSMSWERSVEIEEYKTVRESDWSIPPGGRKISQSEEIHHYNQVLDHYETKTRTYTEQVLDHYEEYVSGYRDLGNGHFEEITSQRPVYRTETRTETYQEPVYVNIPVYQTKYVYDIEKWVHQSYKKTSANDKNPYWSDYKCKENEREGVRNETYTIIVKDEDGESKDYTLPFSQWNILNAGQSVKLKASIFGDAELILKEDG